ncbi:hypothetical protein PG994_006527 [Apiospora phragmitis]|uniref:Uncharacterized protein n=1 Tax=Apiospora phragmitis TaxID=2905665 RepID=A0ABR1VFA4_9PEZI
MVRTGRTSAPTISREGHGKLTAISRSLAEDNWRRTMRTWGLTSSIDQPQRASSRGAGCLSTICVTAPMSQQSGS